MTTFIKKQLKARKIVTFPIYETWRETRVAEDLNE